MHLTKNQNKQVEIQIVSISMGMGQKMGYHTSGEHLKQCIVNYKIQALGAMGAT